MRHNKKRLFAVAVAVLSAAVVWSARAAEGSPAHDPHPSGKSAADKANKNSCNTCLERGVVLDPNQFTQGYEPDVKLAYEAARKYPDLIDRMHCFCECKESQREHHKTLLTCFTNLHAAGCGVCQREAIMAAKLKAQGVSDDEVEITVESIHKTDGHPPTFGRGL
jgi:hypothetical protein